VPRDEREVIRARSVYDFIFQNRRAYAQSMTGGGNRASDLGADTKSALTVMAQAETLPDLATIDVPIQDRRQYVALETVFGETDASGISRGCRRHPVNDARHCGRR
jgi:hypothetical protein